MDDGRIWCFFGDVSSFQRVDTTDWFEGTGFFRSPMNKVKSFSHPATAPVAAVCCARVSCKKTGVCWKQRIIAKTWLRDWISFFVGSKSWEISFPKDLLSQKMIIPYITPIPRLSRACFFIPKIFSSWATNEAANFRNPGVPRGNLKPCHFLVVFVVRVSFFYMGVSSLKWWYPHFTPQCWVMFSRNTNQ